MPRTDRTVALMRPAALALMLALTTACSGGLGVAARAQDLGSVLTSPQAPRAPQVARSLRGDVSALRPARMLVIGDSLSEGFGTLLASRAPARDLAIDVTNAGRNSTGLARIDYYDWPANFATLAAQVRPDIVVAHFGANDMQAIIEPQRRTPLNDAAYDAVYTEQIHAILETAAAQGAVVYLLGPATDSLPNLNAHLARLNPLFAAAAAASGAVYFPLRPFTSGPGGAFAQSVAVNGTVRRIRTGDGSHFNGFGYTLVADAILDDMIARFPELAPAPASALGGLALASARIGAASGPLSGLALQ